MKTSSLILAAGLFLVSLQSCDFNDLDPTDFVGKEKAFEDVAAVGSALNGIYSQMSLRNTLLIAEYIADDVLQGGQHGGAGSDTYSWSYSAATGDHTGLWERQYRIINMANQVILYGSEIVPVDEDEEIKLNNYIGNAYFLRAYAHFDLLRFFADFTDEDKVGIPYVTYPHVLGQPGRDKVGECYELLYKDLERAYNLLKDDAPSDVAYASKAAVNALRARIYLYHKKYLHAAVYAAEALKAVPLASRDEYMELWSDKTNKDVILKLPRSNGQDRIGGLFIGQDNSNVFSPSAGFRNIHTDSDIRKNLFWGQGPDREGKTVYIVKKYYGTTDNIGLNDEKLFRASEMKLIEIESLIYQDKIEEANEQLNRFRQLRIDGWGNVSYDKNALIDQLLLERRRELAYEGHRFFDLRRYRKDIVRDNYLLCLFYDDHRQLMPIPLSEIEVNEAIAQQQNPGY